VDEKDGRVGERSVEESRGERGGLRPGRCRRKGGRKGWKVERDRKGLGRGARRGGWWCGLSYQKKDIIRDLKEGRGSRLKERRKRKGSDRAQPVPP